MGRRREGTSHAAGRRQRLTAEQRAQFARDRKALVGKLITQEPFVGALVAEHIRGSQYLLRLGDGTEVYASHKKQRLNPLTGAFSEGGWSLWESR